MRKGRKVFHLTEEEAGIIQELRLSRRPYRRYPLCKYDGCLTQAKDDTKFGFCGHHYNWFKRRNPDARSS